MKIPRLRWVIAAMLFLATMINYADRMALSIVSTDLRRELGMTEQDYSYVVTAFFVAYAIMYAGSGYVVDRLGTRLGFAIFIFVWSAAAMLHGAVAGLISLMAVRFLLGLGEPGNWPAAAKAVAEWFPARMRALGVGIFNAGSSMGSIIAPPVVGFLTIHYGWRFAFVFTGALGFIWLIFWLILYYPPHKNRWLRTDEYDAMKDEVRPAAETEGVAAGSVDWKKILFRRECMTLIWARFFTDPVIYFIIFWLPEYLRKERGFDLTLVATYAWIPFLFGDIGYIAGGWLSGFLIGRGWTLPRARKFSMACGAAIMPFMILAPQVPTAWLALAATSAGTLGHAIWVANLQTLPADLFKGNEMGTASGFTGMGGAIGGIIANLGTGWLVCLFSYTPVFLIAGLMHPLSAVIVYL
jgi:ACS family hexuronate transporter-like MFS transporter